MRRWLCAASSLGGGDAGKFQWIKETLGPKARLIAWSENEDGHLTARDLVTLMCLFNVSLYPNHLNKHPTSAYVSPKSALKSYQDEQASFEAMQPILLNILELYELIATSARGIWNEEKGKKMATTGTSPTLRWVSAQCRPGL